MEWLRRFHARLRKSRARTGHPGEPRTRRQNRNPRFELRLIAPGVLPLVVMAACGNSAPGTGGVMTCSMFTFLKEVLSRNQLRLSLPELATNDGVGAGVDLQCARKFQRNADARVSERDGLQAVLASFYDGVALQKNRIKHGDFTQHGIERHRGVGEGLEANVGPTRFRGQIRCGNAGGFREQIQGANRLIQGVDKADLPSIRIRIGQNRCPRDRD